MRAVGSGHSDLISLPRRARAGSLPESPSPLLQSSSASIRHLPYELRARGTHSRFPPATSGTCVGYGRRPVAPLISASLLRSGLVWAAAAVCLFFSCLMVNVDTSLFALHRVVIVLVCHDWPVLLCSSACRFRCPGAPVAPGGKPAQVSVSPYVFLVNSPASSIAYVPELYWVKLQFALEVLPRSVRRRV